MRHGRVGNGHTDYPAIAVWGGRSVLDIAEDPAHTFQELEQAVRKEANAHRERDKTLSLSKAARNGNLSAVRRLVEAGAEIHINDDGDYETRSAIRVAARYQQSDVIQYILEVERDRTECQAYLQEALEQMINEFRYVEADRLARNKISIERAIINNTKALSQACRSDNLSLLKVLIAHGARIEDQEIFAQHRTPLEAAAKYGHVDTVAYLLSKGVTARPVSAKNKQAALRYAHANGHIQVADLLIQAGADLKDPSIHCSLRSAAAQGHMDALERLLDIGVSMGSAYGALQEAAGNGHIDAVHRLLQSGVHVNAQYEGFTALQRAVAGHHSSIVQLLLEVGANTSVLSREGSTVEDCADIDGKAELTQSVNANSILRFSESRAGVEKGICLDCHSLVTELYTDEFTSRVFDPDSYHGFDPMSLDILDLDTLPHPTEFVHLSTQFLQEWDKQVLEASTLTTNIQFRLQDLDAHEIPKTLQEAIQTAHNLNVDYIWIDCLCIVQDSPDDWAAEAALMNKVYRNSYCTIAANRSHPGSLFSVYNVDGDYAEFELPLKNAKAAKVRVFKKLTRWDSLIRTGQLARRGWCFQERELSPRILHWTDEQVLWECRNSSLSEAGALRTQDYYDRDIKMYQRMQRILDGIEHKSVEEIYESWYTTVADYAARDLTKRGDTLPAIGGLARVLNERLRTQYLAGLWYEDISRSLAWRCHRGTRHDTCTAPSWSWASVGRHGGYGNHYQSYHFRDGKTTACTVGEGLSSIHGHNIRLATADPYGNVISGQLLVSGPAIWATLERKAYNDTEIVLRGLDSVTSHRTNEVTEHCKGHAYERSRHRPSRNYRGVLEIDVESDAHLYCSVICIALFYYDDEKPQRREAVGLGLVPVEGESNTYRRIGRVSDMSLDDLMIAPVHNLIII
ncbi:uncharacterized protein N0V89_002196 [Didymosphaeria variabile]|uniref:Heterokaryon incompatibility domain-containing protein n=1 Tax=Didymosphaeria variabile TaxID=1932322 RepID=A0A9W9CE58_9PLEO|nr:uncharacterized protein N0V89_002196 [Didymosphaeria variabile]KAJ4357620.1 hypothetical protein N0V89_002196 [Didymosphaeria variabile]